MRIASSTTTMAATHRFARSEETSSEMRTWLSRPPSPERTGRSDRFDLSAQAADAVDGCVGCDDEPTTADPKLQVLIAIIEKFTGRPVHVIDASDVTGDRSGATSATGAPAPRGRGWGMQIDTVHRVEETEQTAVSIRASITDADGNRRELRLDLTMSRHFVEESRMRIRAGDAPMKDPLIVTLDGSMARLGDDTTSFDLDVDGTNDRVRLTAGTSSFLVRDLDGNGAITDGRELFGATSGDGFADLAALDDDGNGWIDAGDAAFAELSLAGPDGLRSLADAGVGAISVRSVDSPFTITDGANGSTVLGQVRSTGMVVRADGGVGAVQHVDLVV